ncbi:ankyrin repeat domain-containing protein [Gaetbulibacter aestuarii]|uniref:Ankyrin repeat domain-containing protein n=1 Tax=Gaetbulibacter aestuarii TaxID=1502358 RepID=A0ABW7MUY7_9FLAO
MKTINIIAIKLTPIVMLLTVLLVSSCRTSEEEKNEPFSKLESTIEKPNVDIQTAVITGNIDAVKQHIKAGTNLNEKEPLGGSTPLISAATFNKPEIAKALIDAHADLSIKNNDGATALHVAAFLGRIEIVQLLIDANADKGIRNKYGATPRESIIMDFNEVKPVYDMLNQQLSPMGFELDLDALQKARPVIAMMLQ